jgi:hypothetical protein
MGGGVQVYTKQDRLEGEKEEGFEGFFVDFS